MRCRRWLSHTRARTAVKFNRVNLLASSLRPGAVQQVEELPREVLQLSFHRRNSEFRDTPNDAFRRTARWRYAHRTLIFSAASGLLYSSCHENYTCPTAADGFRSAVMSKLLKQVRPGVGGGVGLRDSDNQTSKRHAFDKRLRVRHVTLSRFNCKCYFQVLAADAVTCHRMRRLSEGAKKNFRKITAVRLFYFLEN